MTKYTQALNVRFDNDVQLESVRKNTDTRIAELQKATNDLASQPGRWLGRQIFTKSGTYQSTPGTKTRLVRQIGGGGGGAGSNGSIGDASGAPGNSGWALEYRVIGDDTLAGTVTIGAGGAAGTSAPTDGGTGGDTTFAINDKTYIAKGGTGGTSATNSNGAPKFPATGSSQPPLVDFVWYVPGQAGFQGLGVGLGFTGASGGAGPFGSGAPAANAGPVTGGPGLGYGAGGGGSMTNLFSSGGRPGTAGVVVIDEFS